MSIESLFFCIFKDVLHYKIEVCFSEKFAKIKQ